jgi:23S rRNA (uracil1939-C5)-methyltransferase
MTAPAAGELATVADLAHDGRGVARLAGKAVFVAGALPGETVRLARRRRRARHDEAELLEVLVAAPGRVTPPCPAFGRCGGCALQHLAPADQLRAKERQLMAELERIGRVAPGSRLPPLTGPVTGYRRRARLGVKYVRRTRRVLVGFRERDSPLLADLTACPVLAAPVGPLLGELAALIGALTVPDQIAQIEVAIAPEATALVFRNLVPLAVADHERLAAFGQRHALDIWLQPGGVASAAPLAGAARALRYRLPEFDVEVAFGPLDFVQVNAALNERMVALALRLLDAAPGERVLDLFCGLGNFTLPLARRAAAVLGVEGEAGLVERARANARLNGLDNARFALADLARDPRDEPWARERFERVLLDPPRAGALAVLPLVAKHRPARIVYVSCHPGTLARDAGVLVHEHGYRLAAAGVMDMFPHTAHVESIAVFEPAP